MKQTLEEAVNEIGGVHPDWDKITCFRIGFKEGARWQTKQPPWVSVKENGYRMKMKTSSFYVNMVRFLTVHIATMYGSAWMVISMTRTKVTQFTLQ